MGFGTKNFYGKIDGKSVNDAYSCMDTTTNSLEDRKANVARVFYTNGKGGRMFPLWERLFDQPDAGVGHIKLVLTSGDSVYSETNVAKTLDSIGTYLLHKQMNDKKCEYVIFNNDKMFREAMKAESLDKIMERSEDVSGDDTEAKMLLLADSRNYKKEVKQQIFATDYEDPEIGEMLKSYRKFADGLTEKINAIRDLAKLSNDDIEELDLYYVHNDKFEEWCKKGVINVCGEVYRKYDMGNLDVKPSEFIATEKAKLRKLNQHRSDIHDDMINLKDGIKRTIYFKACGETPVTPEYDTENLDFWDKNLVRMVARINKGECRTEVGRAWCDAFDTAVIHLTDEGELTAEDHELIDTWRSDKNFEAYCESIDVNLKTAYHRVTSIITSIQRQMVEDYELDYYYTEMAKGDWKICSKCGEARIKNEYYFYKNKDSKDGFRSVCKKCESKNAK